MDLTTRPSFEAHLALDGYERDEVLVMLLEGEMIGDAKPHDIRPLSDDDGWRTYATLYAIDWQEYDQRTGRSEGDDVATAMLRSKRSKVPLIRYS